MATNANDLIDNIIAKKLAQKEDPITIAAKQATGSLSDIRARKPLDLFMQGAKAIGEGSFGDQIRTDRQAAYDLAATNQGEAATRDRDNQIDRDVVSLAKSQLANTLTKQNIERGNMALDAAKKSTANREKNKGIYTSLLDQGTEALVGDYKGYVDNFITPIKGSAEFKELRADSPELAKTLVDTLKRDFKAARDLHPTDKAVINNITKEKSDVLSNYDRDTRTALTQVRRSLDLRDSDLRTVERATKGDDLNKLWGNENLRASAIAKMSSVLGKPASEEDVYAVLAASDPDDPFYSWLQDDDVFEPSNVEAAAATYRKRLESVPANVRQYMAQERSVRDKRKNLESTYDTQLSDFKRTATANKLGSMAQGSMYGGTPFTGTLPTNGGTTSNTLLDFANNQRISNPVVPEEGSDTVDLLKNTAVNAAKTGAKAALDISPVGGVYNAAQAAANLRSILEGKDKPSVLTDEERARNKVPL